MASYGRNDKTKPIRVKYVVGPAAIWYVDAAGDTQRAEPEDVVDLDPAQARQFKNMLRPYIPESEEDEEEIEPELPMAAGAPA